ncbi:MAG: zinc ribbon domain-containing protein [Acidobacteria bacterium]|nr:zinc ribbon domain-containing protein [Acidobacteriota bacterium]
MKHCPECGAEYTEDVIKFCTKDGAPLVEDTEPKFTALPSESSGLADDEPDFGEETVIRRKPAAPANTFSEQQGERIVIPAAEQTVRPRKTVAYTPPPQQPNTVKTVILTMIGTIFLLGLGALLFWFLQKDKTANVNVNTNPPNSNLNSNFNAGFDSNFNFNASVPNINSNYNFNLNSNIKSPTPTPSPRPSASISPTPTPGSSPTPRPTPTTMRPSPTPTPRSGPRPTFVPIGRPTPTDDLRF